ncbi:helix-turn-helix domain-containing protein [Spirosoma arcticum]
MQDSERNKILHGKALANIRKSKGWSQDRLAELSGVKRGAIAQIELGNNSASRATAEAIAKAFGVTREEFEISILEEVQLLDRREMQRFQAKALGSLTKGNVPFYDVDVLAFDWTNKDSFAGTATSTLAIPGTEDCDFSCRVVGNSTIIKIKPGSIIVCKEAKDRDLIQFGDLFLVVTAENRWLRFVRKHNQADHYLLKSDSADFDDIDCPKEKVLRLFAVKMIVSQEQI